MKGDCSMEITKRDGRVVPFEINKIKNAILKAFKENNQEIDPDVLDIISIRAVAKAQKKSPNLNVEIIQDSVESSLMECGYDNIAKSYILYRKNRENVRNTLLDVNKVVGEYLNLEDWRVKENSTVTYSVGGFILSNSGAITANYWLNNIYDKEITDAHKNCDMHLHDLSFLGPYCAGWSLKQLILEGLGGVTGKISSKPAKHLHTLCNQMVNFLGITQNEWAGAQAFSSFDTYLSAFVKKDNMVYKDVKQCIQSFIFGVNTPSRWGCVDTDTEVLSVDGFKRYDELKAGDKIYTWKDGNLEINTVNAVVVKDYKGKMHSYRHGFYHQFVTPEHRMLVKKFNEDEYVIKHSENIFNAITPYALPTRFKDSNTGEKLDLSNEWIQMAAIVYSDGSIDIRNGSVHKIIIYKSPNRFGNELIKDLSEKLGLKYTFNTIKGGFDSDVNTYTFYSDSARAIANVIGMTKKDIDKKFLTMSQDQAALFLLTWSQFDGNDEKEKIQCDNTDIIDSIQQIALLAGRTSYITRKNRTVYVKLRNADCVYNIRPTEVDYDGIVWCPNVDNGTAVFRKDHNTFISGQSQAPFTNVTLDWVVPEDLKNMPAIVGGEPQDFTYGDCQKEMDMVNKAFIEIMLEGDANGRGFQYPMNLGLNVAYYSDIV